MIIHNYINEIIDSYKALRKFKEKGLKFEEDSLESRLLLKKGYIKWTATSIGIGSVAKGNYQGGTIINHLVLTSAGERFRKHTKFLDYLI